VVLLSLFLLLLFSFQTHTTGIHSGIKHTMLIFTQGSCTIRNQTKSTLYPSLKQLSTVTFYSHEAVPLSYSHFLLVCRTCVPYLCAVLACRTCVPYLRAVLVYRGTCVRYFSSLSLNALSYLK
jgi:hypothetical protein